MATARKAAPKKAAAKKKPVKAASKAPVKSAAKKGAQPEEPKRKYTKRAVIQPPTEIPPIEDDEFDDLKGLTEHIERMVSAYGKLKIASKGVIIFEKDGLTVTIDTKEVRNFSGLGIEIAEQEVTEQLLSGGGNS